LLHAARVLGNVRRIKSEVGSVRSNDRTRQQCQAGSSTRKVDQIEPILARSKRKDNLFPEHPVQFLFRIKPYSHLRKPVRQLLEVTLVARIKKQDVLIAAVNFGQTAQQPARVIKDAFSSRPRRPEIKKVDANSHS